MTQIRYRQNTKGSLLIPVTEGLIPPTLTNPLAVLFFVRTSETQADDSAVAIDLRLSVTNALEKGVIGLEIDPAALDALPPADTYWWDVRVVMEGAIRSASAVDGDVADAVTFDSPTGDFINDGVVAGDYLVISTGTNIGKYKIATIPLLTQLTIEAAFPFPDPAEAAGQTYEVRQALDPVYYPKDSAPFEIIGSGVV